MLEVPLPRTESTPAWGARSAERLETTIDIARGWSLILDQPEPCPIIEIIGRCDPDGIEALLDLAIEVDTGAYGNILGRDRPPRRIPDRRQWPVYATDTEVGIADRHSGGNSQVALKSALTGPLCRIFAPY